MKRFKAILIILLVVSLGTYLRYSLRPEGGTKPSLEEEVMCLSAVCASDKKFGTECIEFQPNVARVTIAQDNNTHANRLVVETNAYQCR